MPQLPSLSRYLLSILGDDEVYKLVHTFWGTCWHLALYNEAHKIIYGLDRKYKERATWMMNTIDSRGKKQPWNNNKK